MVWRAARASSPDSPRLDAIADSWPSVARPEPRLEPTAPTAAPATTLPPTMMNCRRSTGFSSSNSQGAHAAASTFGYCGMSAMDRIVPMVPVKKPVSDRTAMPSRRRKGWAEATCILNESCSIVGTSSTLDRLLTPRRKDLGIHWFNLDNSAVYSLVSPVELRTDAAHRGPSTSGPLRSRRRASACAERFSSGAAGAPSGGGPAAQERLDEVHR